MAIKYRSYIPQGFDEHETAIAFIEFDSPNIAEGVIRDFQFVNETPVSIYELKPFFENIQHKGVFSIDIDYRQRGADLKLVSDLLFFKKAGNPFQFTVEAGHDDDSKDTLVAFKMAEVTIQDVILTTVGASVVVAITHKETSSIRPYN
jgi:hypothetical protein